MSAANSEITKIMESMGWTDGTFIPIANEENKYLMETMQQLLDAKEAKSDTNQDLEQRFTNLQKHISNAKQDIQQNLVRSPFEKWTTK